MSSDNESASNKRIKVENNDRIAAITAETTDTATITNKVSSYLGRTPPINPIFEVIYKSDDYCLVNKPYDVNIDDDGKGRNETLIKYLEDKYQELKGIIRFVNRIDYATSGIVVTALNKKAASKGMELFQNRDTTKTYLAIVHGHVELDEGLIDKPIANDTSDLNSFKMCIGNNTDNKGRASQTNYKVLERGYIYRSKQFYNKIFNNNNSQNKNKSINNSNNSEDNSIDNSDNSNNISNDNTDDEIIKIPVTKLELYPKTGRRHQLRIHLHSIGHLIVGDETYGPIDSLSKRMMLHSWKLVLPFKNQPHINVETQDPFTQILINQ